MKALDPALEQVLATVDALDLSDPAQARSVYDRHKARRMAPTADGCEVVHLRAHSTGIPPVSIMLVRPAGSFSRKLPCLVWAHGGGFVLGDARQDLAWIGRLALQADCAVASVQYRLAPEHRYPAANDDVEAAFRYLSAESSSLNLDANRLGLGGRSAGAALAISVSLRCPNEAAFLALEIPEIDDRANTASAREYTDTPLWNRTTLLDSWRHFLGPERTVCGGTVPVDAAPARICLADLSGLPPTFMSVAWHDPVRDEALLFAHRLSDAGVAVELIVFDNVVHAFHNFEVPTCVNAQERSRSGIAHQIKRCADESRPLQRAQDEAPTSVLHLTEARAPLT